VRNPRKRVRASDANTGIVSDYALQSFETISPDDGNYRYDLTITPPASCRPFRPAYTVDDQLTVNGDALRFEPERGLYRPGIDSPGFAVHLTRAGTGVTGTIGGFFVRVTQTTFGSLSVTRSEEDFNDRTAAPPVAILGQSDSQGGFTGTFAGYLGFEYINPELRCTASNITWSLAPHVHPPGGWFARNLVHEQ